MDAVIALGGIALGAILAWLSSLYGANKEAQREHDRWLRERRFDAWSTFLSACTAVPSIPRHDLVPHPPDRDLTSGELEAIRDSMAQCNEAAARLHDAAGRLDTLGPPDLTDRTRPILAQAGIVLLGDSDQVTFEEVADALKRMGAFVDLLRPEIRTHFEKPAHRSTPTRSSNDEGRTTSA